MKNILVAFLLVSSTCVANANDLEANVNSELAKVESTALLSESELIK